MLQIKTEANVYGLTPTVNGDDNGPRLASGHSITDNYSKINQKIEYSMKISPEKAYLKPFRSQICSFLRYSIAFRDSTISIFCIFLCIRKLTITAKTVVIAAAITKLYHRSVWTYMTVSTAQ